MTQGNGSFWLALHELVKSLESEGKTRSQRQDAIVAELLKMRPTAADAFQAEYRYLVEELVTMRRAIRRKRKDT